VLSLEVAVRLLESQTDGLQKTIAGPLP
jgi:hypothetical protein